MNNQIRFLNGSPITLVREKGHLWLRCKYQTECLFTEKELTKLHYSFGHFGIRRLHGLFKKARPRDVDENTRSLFEKIQSKCKECQFLAPKLYVVKVSVPHEYVVFNSKVIVYIIFIQGKRVLHVVDRATHFQAARFLHDESTESVWKTVMQMWMLIYLGAPDNLRHDEETKFVSPKLQAME